MADTKIIAVANQKGGVGKTTTTANLGYALALLGKKVLLIDFDPQTSLTQYLNIEADETYYEITDLLSKQLDDPEYIEEDLEAITFDDLLEKCIVTPSYSTIERVRGEDGKFVAVHKRVPFAETLDLIPSSLALADYELYVSSKQIDARSYQLLFLIQKIVKKKDYDYILIDCAPSLGVLTMNAIAAASTGVLVPTNLDLMSTRGVVNLINVVTTIQRTIIEQSRGSMPHYGTIGVVLNLFRSGRSVDEKLQSDMERYYPFTVFKSCIPESVNAKKAVLGGLMYAQVYKAAEAAYKKLAKELEKTIAEMEKEGPRVKTMGEELQYSIDDLLEIMKNEEA